MQMQLTQRVGLEESGSHHHLIENEFVLDMIELKNCCIGAKQQSLTPYVSVDNHGIFFPFGTPDICEHLDCAVLLSFPV